MNKYLQTLLLLTALVWPALSRAEDKKKESIENLVAQLDAAVTNVSHTGKFEEIAADIDREVEAVVLAPAYWPAKGFGLHKAVLQDIQETVDQVETGHLFFISGKRIVAHRALSLNAEPVPGHSRDRKVFFRITRDPSASRPVRIQIVEH